MRIKTMTVILTLFTFVGLLSAADQYVIDRSHSSVGFSVKHMVISSVKGSFTDFSGTIMYDEADISNSSVSVSIKTASIATVTSAAFIGQSYQGLRNFRPTRR